MSTTVTVTRESLEVMWDIAFNRGIEEGERRAEDLQYKDFLGQFEIEMIEQICTALGIDPHDESEAAYNGTLPGNLTCLTDAGIKEVAEFVEKLEEKEKNISHGEGYRDGLRRAMSFINGLINSSLDS